MPRKIIEIIFAALIAFPALAQLPEQEPVATTPPLGAVFEIIQNSRAMKETYLLNRYTGETWQLVQSTKRYVWQKIPIEKNEKDIAVKDLKNPMYQISISGIAAKGTYLINTETGATWVLFEDPEQGKFWGALPGVQ